GKFAEAQKRYDEVRAQLAPEDANELLLFEARCLAKLGKADESAAKLRQFRTIQLPNLVRVTMPNEAAAPPDPARTHDAREALAAEIFLSLNDADGAIAYLRNSIAQTADEQSKCFSAIVLAEVLLLLDRRGEYADVVSATLLPFFDKLLPGMTDPKR